MRCSVQGCAGANAAAVEARKQLQRRKSFVALDVHALDSDAALTQADLNAALTYPRRVTPPRSSLTDAISMPVLPSPMEHSDTFGTSESAHMRSLSGYSMESDANGNCSFLGLPSMFLPSEKENATLQQNANADRDASRLILVIKVQRSCIDDSQDGGDETIVHEFIGDFVAPTVPPILFHESLSGLQPQKRRKSLKGVPIPIVAEGNAVGSKTMFHCPHPNCDREFLRATDLKSHERAHSGDRPFACVTCSMRFSRNHDLKRCDSLDYVLNYIL
jgi:hypothetical protein